MPFLAARRAAPFVFAAILGLPAAASAQSAVPLTPELLELSWVVTGFRGKSPDSLTPTLAFDSEGGMIWGRTACDTEWSARYSGELPAIEIFDLHALAYDCPYGKEVSAFLMLLEEAASLATGTEGLEIRDRDGARIMLMQAGG